LFRFLGHVYLLQFILDLIPHLFHDFMSYACKPQFVLTTSAGSALPHTVHEHTICIRWNCMTQEQHRSRADVAVAVAIKHLIMVVNSADGHFRFIGADTGRGSSRFVSHSTTLSDKTPPGFVMMVNV
jgi:hypothetical protein